MCLRHSVNNGCNIITKGSSCFEAQVQTTAIHVIKEKVNPLARYYNFFSLSRSGPASEAGGGRRKNLGEYQSIPIVLVYPFARYDTLSEIRDFRFPSRTAFSRVTYPSFLLAGERKMISPIGREVDRGGGAMTAGQRQAGQQRPRADCSELLHKRVRVALTREKARPVDPDWHGRA